MTRLVVLSAGLSAPSSTRLLADRLTEATVRHLEGPVELEVVELRPLAYPLAERMTTGFAGPELDAALGSVRRADALIAVTPVFAASYSGLFKMFLDVLDRDALAGTPVLVAATGGTARHSMVLDHALRPLFNHLHAVVASTGVYAATDDFGETGLDSRVSIAGAELAALVGGPGARPAPRRARERSVEEELAEPTPFEDLMRRAGAGAG
ncbi:FMN reductase (NADPH) [Nocardioides dokdonensis FR1436]|uniref:FMN reductase (NADPH) n=1 Tax=Nocardioides dokdonensis FR1436 TaxID=1300347 RepID=A0A1A9GQ44_9ACTN|nr:CE1759 family FMN reductase [Nocardioides dokdonensis]ANH39772.1 FMN reductase (NADPH) [Nocardioides dokdonensis FR1436]